MADDEPPHALVAERLKLRSTPTSSTAAAAAFEAPWTPRP